MRCFLLNADKPGVDGVLGEIKSALTDEQITDSVSIQVVDEWNDTVWQKVVEAKTQQCYDHKIIPPFNIRIIAPAKTEEAQSMVHFTVIIFSAHHVSDGFSGLRVFHDFLTFLNEVSQGNHDLPTPRPVLKPVFDRRFNVKYDIYASPVKKPVLSSPSSIWSRSMSRVMSLVVPYVIRTELKEFVPLIPPILSPKEHYVYPFNKPLDCGALYLTGDPENLVKVKAKCKEQRVTLHGGL
jgi:hypothetical protein